MSNTKVDFLYSKISEEQIRETLGDLTGIGLSGVGKMIAVILFVGFVNLILISFGVVDAVWGDELNKLTWKAVGIMFLIGIGFTAFTGFRMYQYAIQKSIEKVYDKAKEVVILPLCIDAVIRAKELKLKGEDLSSGKDFDKAFNLVNIIGEKLNILPRIIKKPLFKLIGTVPLLDIVKEYWTQFDNEDSDMLGQKIYLKVNEFVAEVLQPSIKWLLWLLPVNMIVQLVVLYI